MKPTARDEELATQLKLSSTQVMELRHNEGFTSDDMAGLDENTLRRITLRLEYRDRTRARDAYLRLLEQDENGNIPPDALNTALRELDSLRSRSATQPTVGGVPTGVTVTPRSLAGPVLDPLAGLNPNNSGWDSLGPGNIGGRTRSIVIHPTQPDVIWAGSVGGGVWQTTNGGQSWFPVDDLMANLAVCSMVMDPTDPDTIYAGTGEGFNNLDSLRGGGIFRTTDGMNWLPLAATTKPDFHYVNRLALSANGRTLLAGTRQGIFRSTDAPRLTWTRTLVEAIGDVDFHPTDSRKAVAGGVNNGTAYYTNDGGRTWHEATHPGEWAGRVEVTYAIADPNTVYASVQMTTGEIWRSQDGGRTYSARKSLTPDSGSLVPAQYLRDQGWYDNVIWAGDPTDANFVVVGGVDLWRSINGGDTLTKISDWSKQSQGSPHADHHAIVAHPDFNGTTNRTVFFGNDGGVYKTVNIRTAGSAGGTAGWSELVNTYAVTQFYHAAGNASSGVIIGGAQDNGTIALPPTANSESWHEIFGGDGGYCAADPTDPNVFYGEYVYLNIFRNINGAASSANWWETHISGQYWNSSIGWDWKPSPFTIPDARNQRALFIAPFTLDPNDADRLLAGGVSLWSTEDAKRPNTNTSGPSWRQIKRSIGQRISAIAIAAGNADLIWVGYENGELYRTLDGTADDPLWRKMDQTGPLPLNVGRFCTSIKIDPRDHNTIYATFGGYKHGNIWKSSDGGATWTNLGQTLPEAPIHTVELHPRKANYVYIGSEVGIFASEDGGATWSPTNEGPTNCSVNHLFWLGEVLYCATHGRGMFKIDLANV